MTTLEPPQLTGAPWTPEPGAIVFLPEVTDGMTLEEIYAYLSRDNPSVVFDAEPDEVLVAAADVHNGAMVALIPAFEDLERLELEGGEPLGELHITAFYLGEAEHVDDQTRTDIIATLEEMLADQDVIEAVVFGVGIFNPTGDEPALILNVAGGGLESIRDVIEEALDDADARVPMQHHPWVPHITIAYDTEDNPLKIDSEDIAPQRMGPITIDRVRVAFGGQTTDIPLGLNVIASAERVFHMSGKHDQSTHGRGTSGEAALSSAPVRYDKIRGRAAMEEAGINEAELNAMGRYRGTGSDRINRYHRGIEQAPEDDAIAARVSKDLDSAISKSSLRDDVLVARNTATTSWLPEADDLTGQEWIDPAYVSTTADLNTSRFTKPGGAQMKISVPRGTHAVGLSDHTHESELLLERGLRFRVTADYGTDDRGIRQLDVEVVR